MVISKNKYQKNKLYMQVHNFKFVHMLFILSFKNKFKDSILCFRVFQDQHPFIHHAL